MTVQKIRKYPEDLPPAVLYLDDLEDVVKILAEAYTTEKGAPTFSYTLNDIYEVDSLEDLAQLRRGSWNFRLRVFRSKGDIWSASLQFGFWGNPHVDLAGLKDEKFWAVYGRLKQIFDSRAMKFKHALSVVPGWIWAIVLYASLFVIAGVAKANLLSEKVTGELFLVLVGFVCIWFLALLQPSRVVFRRHHEKTLEQGEDIRNYAKNALIFVLGAVAGEVLKRVLAHWKW